MTFLVITVYSHAS